MSIEKLKLIIFIQALVIVFGIAFLLGYSLMERKVNKETEARINDITVSTTTNTATDEKRESLPVIETVIDDTPVGVSGHSDVGMEFPIPDDESLLR